MASIAVVPQADPGPTGPFGRGEAGVLGLGGLRLTARGRRVLVGLVALLLAVPAVAWGALAVANPPDRAQEVRLETVAPGETLWQYARTVAEPGEDLRDVVAALRELNGLGSAELRAGQVLVLPLE
ncbi:LysM domain-containing protein [Isoptericola sp. CG 20/1183]|uniref:LysM domain-containing protein n=1 Tax=Isoptericola halotolerans TaxID=300560 RepID=A0ABX5ECT1_9MICO|nr:MULTISPECIES: LysM peptidoglycan-binding domain-containing protein [Isoptericola]MCK0116634.1 LysM peptidoglycan-binding domain-containing protein [Isoptericola sp. S6320L]PRZ05601.1 LysM domain-containing protein [Isoptericola halotolerans]PRZ06169.1 LysM domain-containing protein [Isoptericola sp. CG 20/1183]